MPAPRAVARDSAGGNIQVSFFFLLFFFSFASDSGKFFASEGRWIAEVWNLNHFFPPLLPPCTSALSTCCSSACIRPLAVCHSLRRIKCRVLVQNQLSQESQERTRHAVDDSIPVRTRLERTRAGSKTPSRSLCTAVKQRPMMPTVPRTSRNTSALRGALSAAGMTTASGGQTLSLPPLPPPISLSYGGEKPARRATCCKLALDGNTGEVSGCAENV